jgi:hypothetical protein
MNTEISEKLTFDQEKHEYFYEGKKVPGVTRLLQDYGLIDFTGVPKERLEFKSALGTAVHYAISLHNQDDLDEDSMSEEIKPYFLAYKKFCEVHKYEATHTELRLYSKKWRFAGTMDSQGLFNYKGKEVESIIDWKCVYKGYPSANIQTAAYELLFNENFPEVKSKKRFNLILKPTANYEIVECADPGDRNIFLACLTLHHWKERNL